MKERLIGSRPGWAGGGRKAGDREVRRRQQKRIGERREAL